MNELAVEPVALSVGLLVARLVVGLVMAAHGAQKLFGWFGGYGLSGTGGYLEQLGFRPGRAFALAAALGEAGSGLLVALGLFGPVGPALMISVMIVATVTVHWQHGLFAMNNGIEVTLLYATAAATFALTGYGAYSLDTLLGLADAWTAGSRAVILGVGIVAGIANLAIRRRPELRTTQSQG